MEWTRVKPQHILYSSYTPQQRGNLLTLLCLTAHLERFPIEEEMCQHIHYKGLKSLQEALKKRSTTLQEVLNKVLEDAQRVRHERKLNAKHQTTYRNKEKDSKPLHKPLDKIREDKIREEEIDVSPFWEYFLLKTKKKFQLTPSNKDLLLKRIKEGLTFEKFTYAVDRFVEDDWVGRQKNMDLIYCIGSQKGKADNLNKWLNIKPKSKTQDIDEVRKKIWGEKNV